MPDKPHEKHEKLARPESGEFARNELAILGTSCAVIRELAGHLVSRLSPGYHLAYLDTEHEAKAHDPADLLHDGVCLQLTDKLNYRQITFPEELNVFERRSLFASADLVIINGNHHKAAAQILVIDPKKDLQNKLGRLTDVKLILKSDDVELPDYLTHLSAQNIPVLRTDDLDAIAGFVRDFLEKRIPALNGLVLAGGKSTRMGRDKSQIAYYETSQARHLTQQLQPLCTEVFLSCNAEQHAFYSADFLTIKDAFLGLGPMDGILSAMQKNPNTAWLTVACDLPFLSVEMLTYLVSRRDPKFMATAFLDPDGEFPEPLITIWEPKAYPVLLRFLALGYSCPRKVLINAYVNLLTAPDIKALRNVNDPGEYEAAIQHIRETSY